MDIVPISIPPKKLSQSITSSSSSFSVNNIEGWDGDDLTSGVFGDRHFIVFLNDTRTAMEIMEIDPSTIASSSITITRRGLKFDGDQTTEVTDNKLDWPAATTTVQFGTDVPQLIANFVDLASDQTIAGAKIFSNDLRFNSDLKRGSSTVIDSNQQVRAGNGSASAPGYRFVGESQSGFYRIGSNIIGVSTNGSERVRFTNTGMQLNEKASYDSAKTFTGDQEIISKKYADDLAIQGVADASSTTKGATKLSKDPDSATEPIALGINDKTEFGASSFLWTQEQDTPDLTVQVEAGNVYFGTSLVEYAGGNSPSFTAPSSNDRIDILSIDSSGTLNRTAGTEDASPTAPDVPAGEIPIAQIYNRPGQTEILDEDDSSNGYIQKDLRAYIKKGTDIQEFSADGTWNNPGGEGMVLIEAWGAGASGAASADGRDTTGALGMAGAGGGGVYVYRWMKLSDLGATETVTIGEGGVGTEAQATGARDDNNGVDGGNTTFGSHLTAYGGDAGTADSTDATGGHGAGHFGKNDHDGNGIYSGGAGDATDEDSAAPTVGASGDSFYGGASGGSAGADLRGGSDDATSRNGGTSTVGGDGGDGAATANTGSNATATASDGQAPGGGGGAAAAATRNNTATATPGNGADGQVKVTTFF